MNTELYSRIGQFKQYINQLNEHISANDNPNAVSTINKFKKIIMKDDHQQHANQFILDCLKTKNEKLQAELTRLQEEKVNLSEKMNQKKKGNKQMK